MKERCVCVERVRAGTRLTPTEPAQNLKYETRLVSCMCVCAVSERTGLTIVSVENFHEAMHQVFWQGVQLTVIGVIIQQDILSLQCNRLMSGEML